MKSIFTLLTTAFISLSGYAFFDQTRLTISTSGNIPVRIMVDGKKYTNKNGDVTINNLVAGYHTVKIFVQQRQKGQERDRGQFNGAPTYYQVMYNSSIMIKQQFHTDLMVNRFGKVFIDEQPMANGYYEEEENWGDDGNGQGGYNQQPMTPQIFEQFKQAVTKATFDDDKSLVVKQVANNNWFTSVQVKEIVQLFTFESGKLDIAKFLYKYTVDKGSYFIINDAFTFNRTKEDLMKYLQTVK